MPERRAGRATRLETLAAGLAGATRRETLAAGSAGATRRETLAAGLAGAAALALALAPAAHAARGDEGAALSALIRAEEDAVFVYRDVALPDGLGARLAAQDDEHARALASLLEALAMRIPGPARSRDDLPPEALAVLEPQATGARVRAAVAYERVLIDGCARALAALEHANTIRTVATVMAGHAQHHEQLARLAGMRTP